mmetsp:Transcript_7118/g.12779  ORF Transcript_7118/g.12779 Transcript_7118/m.12779 type:complete len:123 (-) Transcript_7118:265-633(-)
MSQLYSGKFEASPLKSCNLTMPFRNTNRKVKCDSKMQYKPEIHNHFVHIHILLIDRPSRNQSIIHTIFFQSTSAFNISSEHQSSTEFHRAPQPLLNQLYNLVLSHNSCLIIESFISSEKRHQ